MTGRNARIGTRLGRGFGLGFALVLAVGMAASPGLAAGTRIQAGDVIRVEVASRPDLSGEFVIASDGTVTLPSAGNVRAAGRTEADLSTDLSRRYSLIDREIPRVVVTITRSATRRVLVLGAVVLPGAYDYADSMNPWDAIALAGGAAEDAYLAGVEIIPGEGGGDRKQEIVDLQTAIQSGTLASLPRLRPGDTIRVSRRGGGGTGSTIFIFGAVAQQGPKSLDAAPDLLAALVLASPTPDANLKKIDIVRRSGNSAEHLRVDAHRYLTGAFEPGNVALHAGDTIYLSRQGTRGGAILSTIGLISPFIAVTTGIIALTR